MGEENSDLVEIVSGVLDLSRYVTVVRDPGAGAIASFAGTTRNVFQGNEVVELQYEAYIPMATLQLKRICELARQKWSLMRMAVAHRVGIVPIGEESVFVAVSSIHRKEALAACQFVIDEIKATAPIWKKEVYSTGEIWKENAEFLERINYKA